AYVWFLGRSRANPRRFPSVRLLGLGKSPRASPPSVDVWVQPAPPRAILNSPQTSSNSRCAISKWRSGVGSARVLEAQTFAKPNAADSHVQGKYPCGKREGILGARGGRAFCAIQ